MLTASNRESTMDDEEMFALMLILVTLIELLEEDESDDDDEELLLLMLMAMHKRRIPRLCNYLSETNADFKQQFRIQRTTFDKLLQLLHPKLNRARPGNFTMHAEKQLLLTLWKMVTADSYRSICDRFAVGMATALTSVRRVTRALMDLAPQFIVWPTGDKVQEVIDGFAACCGFPQVVGVIDTTHICIPPPSTKPEDYLYHNGRHALQLQAVCDHKSRFTHCVVGHLGSVPVHDSSKFSNDTHLLGDAKYTLQSHLLVPYQGDEEHLSQRQKNYNTCHSSTSMPIERAFALLKGRFQSLLSVLNMSDVREIPDFIMACCVLHNVCLLNDDDLDVDDVTIENDFQDCVRPTEEDEFAEIKRRRIADMLPMQL